MEGGFWKDIQEKRLCPETIKCLFKSLADLENLDNNKTSGEINIIDQWYYRWNIINNEINITNIYKIKN